MVAQKESKTSKSKGEADELVSVKDLKMYFPVRSGVIFQKKIADIKAVDGVSFSIKRGETLGPVSYTHLTLPTILRV